MEQTGYLVLRLGMRGAVANCSYLPSRDGQGQLIINYAMWET
jgi:hypothetical protein